MKKLALPLIILCLFLALVLVSCVPADSYSDDNSSSDSTVIKIQPIYELRTDGGGHYGYVFETIHDDRECIITVGYNGSTAMSCTSK